MNYRREIDGLRAVAVLPVILFHAGFTAFGGGFVGVDIFFVISGYLITSLLLADLRDGRFSLTDFYERRARRILPALFLVLAVTVPLAWLCLPAEAYKDFSQSLAAVAVFSSNFLFWHESGYFDSATELKPLLHTWSLAVEEQFYIVFPLLLAGLWRVARHYVVPVLAVLLAISLGYAQWAAINTPTTAFYLLPARSWELLLGGLAACYLARQPQRNWPVAIREMAGAIGLGLIAYAIFSFSKATPFPGIPALVPTIGALLIIVFTDSKTLAGKVLGHRWVVGIGLISYSAYLWHQPLFAFFRHSHLAGSGAMAFGLLSLLALGLGYLSWRFVETPFRRKPGVSRHGIFLMAILGSTICLALGMAGHVKQGFPGTAANPAPAQTKRLDQNIIIIGDSHGDHLAPGLASITTGSVENLTSPGCIPLRNVDRYDSRFKPGDCASKINGWLDSVIARDPDALLILSSMGPVYLDGETFRGKDPARVTGLGVTLVTDPDIKDRYRVYEIGMHQTLKALSALRRTKVIVALDIPELGIDNGCMNTPKTIQLGHFVLPDMVARLNRQQCAVPVGEYQARTQRYKQMVRQIVAAYPAVRLFDPTPAFCDAVSCKGFDARYGFLYRDIDHLSAAGSRYYAEAFASFVPLSSPSLSSMNDAEK